MLEQDPETSQWLGENVLHRPAFAGYRALRLLLKVASEDISTLQQSTWIKWAPIILSYPLMGDNDEKIQGDLIRIAYKYAPGEFIGTLMLLIDKENREYSNIFIIRHIENLWDERLADSLLEKVRDPKLKPTCMGTILGYLLDHKNNGAKNLLNYSFRLTIHLLMTSELKPSLQPANL